MRYKQQSLFKPLGSNKNPLNFSNNKDNLLKIPIIASNRFREGKEGTSSVAYEILIMNCKNDFINMFIFNYLASNINLFIFSSLTLDINLFIFNFLMSRFCIPKNIFRKQKRTAVCGRSSIFAEFKLIPENDDLLPSRHK